MAAGAAPAAAQSGNSGADRLLSIMEGYDAYVEVCYNSAAQEFLVVWLDFDRGLYIQRYDWRGNPMGDNLLINDSGSTYWPAVAYSPGAGSYLLVWGRDPDDGTDDNIYGQRLSADGSPLGPVLVLDQSAGGQYVPDVATDGDDFVVVWQGWDGDVDAIFARRVTGGGAVDPTTWSVARGGGAHRSNPDIAHDDTSGEYLVVFSYSQVDTAEIHARRLAPDGSPPGAEYSVAAHPDAIGSHLAATPWDGTGGYLVVWQDSRNGSADIYGRVVLAGGDGLFDGDDFAITDLVDSDQVGAAVALSPSTGNLLVTWSDSRADATSASDIYGQRLAADAGLEGSNFPVSAAYGEQGNCAVASGQSADAYLVVWADFRTYGDIYGQRVAGSGSLLWYEFAVSAQPGAQAAPAVAYDPDGGQYLAVWQDQVDGHWAIHGQRLSADGFPLETPWPIESDGHDNVQPVVAYSGSEQVFVVVWADEDLDHLEGRQVPAAGWATVPFSVPDSAGGRHPDLAYDEPENLFLLAWDDGADVYAHILAGDGSPDTGDSTLVANGEGLQLYPCAVSDPDAFKFLVVYQTDLGGGQVRLQGQHLLYSGNLWEPSFPVAGGDGVDRFHPAVTYNGDAGQYLVVYEYQLASEDLDIRGQLMSYDVPDGPELVIRNQPAGADQLGPDVEYSPESSRYYVVWAEDQGSGDGYDLYGQWLDYAGNPLSELLPVFRYSGDQTAPRLAYDMINLQGLVVWADTRRGPEGDVYARLGALDLEPPVALFTRDPAVGKEGDIFVFNAWPSHDNMTPPGAIAVRWDWTSDGNWDTSWTFDKHAVRVVSVAGTYNVTLQVRDLMNLLDDVTLPVLVLPDNPNTPPAAVLAVDSLVGLAGTTFHFDASGSTDNETPPADLLFRWDWENDGVFDTDWSGIKVRNYVFTDAGLHSVRVEVKDAGGLTDAAVRVVLVLPGAAVSLEVTPASAALYAGDTLQYHATAWGSYGNQANNPATTWSLAGALAGQIDESGLFTAGFVAGIYPDEVMAASGSATDTATVTIVYPYRLFVPLVSR